MSRLGPKGRWVTGTGVVVAVALLGWLAVRAILPQTGQQSGQQTADWNAAAKQAAAAIPKNAEQARVELGRVLFFDTRLSGDHGISCATCHVPEKAWADGQALSRGYPGTQYFRNTPTILGAAQSKRLYWDGRFSGTDMQSLIRDHITEAHFMAADGPLVVERLRQVPAYEQYFQAAYGGEPSFGGILRAIEAFLKTIAPVDSPYDRYEKGDKSALSAEAVQGLELFRGKAGCIQCHSGPLLSDGQYHNLGLGQNPDVFQDPQRHITFRRFFATLGVPTADQLREDIGLAALTHKDADSGQFRTPSLREVARTAPYMHNGTLADLAAVIEFYDRGGGNGRGRDPLLKSLRLTGDERQALVAFLESLSSPPVNVDQPAAPEYMPRKLGAN